MQHNLSDIVDITRIQQLTKSFYSATGIHSTIFSVAGESLAVSGWQDICADFHRKHPLTEKRCRDCAVLLHDGIAAGKSWEIHHCPNGLICGATPIVVGGDLIANTCGGQILSHKLSKKALSVFRNLVSERRHTSMPSHGCP